ncbi:hypothetical protein [Candidatus Poriferisodalis sp.]|uniref:hypothetical protein n=1 Tax=Candidatus Poriferisodalis sp. TaxID=3101277 RepID=UPI003C6F6F89
MTVSATPTRTQPSLRGASSRRGDQGLIALEWLLIVGAVAGLAASTVLVVQRVADDAAGAPVEPGVRFIDAEIAAAAVGAEATDFRLGQIPVDVVNDFNEPRKHCDLHGPGLQRL